MSGLFSSLNIATRGMSVQQKSIDVTSHNIANANTVGYSRQRAIIETSMPFGMPTLNNAAEPGQIGTGAQISAIQRYRDAFLDYQTRVETSTKGQFDSREKLLGEVETIFNEPSDTGLSTLMGKFFDSWQQLSKQPQSSNARTIVAQQSAAMADDLNHTYDQLSKLKDNVQLEIKDSVFDVNSKLRQLDALNSQIIGVSITGNQPNDIMDKRDLLIDELSAKFNINVEKTALNGIDIKPGDANSPYVVKAQDPGNSSRLSYISSIVQDTSDPSGQTYIISYNKLGDASSSGSQGTLTVTNMDAAKLKDIDESRVLWASSDGTAVDSDGIDAGSLSLFKPTDGEFKGNQSVQKDVDDYMDQLNALAKSLAFSVNAVHSGQASAGDDSIPFFVNGSVAQYNDDGTMKNLGDINSGILGGEKDITAGNISVNKEILTDVMKIKTRTHDDKYPNEIDNIEDGENDGERAKAIAGLRDILMKVQDITSTSTREDFIGTGADSKLSNDGMTLASDTGGMKMDNYFNDMIDRLGIQSQEAQRMVKNQDALLGNFEESRASVSGVSLDEEMANLIQYQHAYQASAKIISTIDQLLDVVVNGLKK